MTVTTPKRDPRRIQRKRAKGWRMPDGAVYVGRPTRWGNPFVVGDVVEVRISGTQDGAGAGFYEAMDYRGFDVSVPLLPDFRLTAEVAVMLYRDDLLCALEPFTPDERPAASDVDRQDALSSALAELRGHDLACWCPLDQPCHADVLLELANVR